MSNHTPGPWYFWSRKDGLGHHTNWAIATVESQAEDEAADDGCVDETIAGIWSDTPESEANARLIAAAPEMLEALKGFVAAIDRCIADDDASLVDEITDEIEQMARSAIAKAEGK